MKLARYVGEGRIEIRDEPPPSCPQGGLLVKTLASGLCSGELMAWYMDKKIPHVLGHEVCGRVIESQDERFPVGALVSPHHHAPCLQCELCRKGLYVHCEQWKRTKLDPGGMSEIFAVAKENLTDTHRVDDLRPRDAALMEPLACVAKSIRLGGPEERPCAVLGLGTMGLMHMLSLRPHGSPPGAPAQRRAGEEREGEPSPVSHRDEGGGASLTGYEPNPARREWALRQGLQAKDPSETTKADVIFVCPGFPEVVDQAIEMAAPGGTVVLFAPMPPGGPSPIDLNKAYFKDLNLVSSYSCGPNDTQAALETLRAGKVRAEQVVSDFTGIDDLPKAYLAMRAGDILKAMVIFE